MSFEEGEWKIDVSGMESGDFMKLVTHLRGNVQGNTELGVRAEVSGFVARNKIKCDGYTVTKIVQQ